MANIDAFCKMPDIPGESEDADHPKWVELMSAEFSCSAAEGRSGAEGADLSFGRFTLTKRADAATPLLFQALWNRKVFGEVTVEFCREFDKSRPYLRYILCDASIAEMRQVKVDGLPVDELGFRFGQIKVEYEQHTKSGRVLGHTEANWHLEKGMQT